MAAPNLEDLFSQIIRAIAAIASKSNQAWVSWQKVASNELVSLDDADHCSSIASLPNYRHYFVQDRNQRNVKLSEDGVEYVSDLPEASFSDPLAPQSVAHAIRHYASKLHALHIRVESIANVAVVKSKIVQAIRLETSDEGHFPSGTRVTYKPHSVGSPWTEGTVVGHDAQASLLFIAFATEVPDEHLPGNLMIDTKFLLKKLADQVAQLPATPAHAKRLFGKAELGQSIPVPNAEAIKDVLANLARPWTHILWGPPGAGKTFAIARFVAATLATFADSKFLLVAPSNLAVDVLVEELLDALAVYKLDRFVNERRILRYGYSVKESILNHRELLGPEGADVMSAKIKSLAESLRQAERSQKPEVELAQRRAEVLAAQEELTALVRDHAAYASVVATTNTSSYLPNSPIKDIEADFVLVDEASMTPPAHCYLLASKARAGLLLAGDPRQLGPVIEHEDAPSDALRLWMGKDVFDAASVCLGQGENRALNLKAACLLRIEEQRRCSAPIWSLVENLYPRVKSSVQQKAMRQIDALVEIPVLLLNTAGTDSAPCSSIGSSWQNKASAELALEVATAIVGSRVDETVAIICPYRAQARLIGRRLRHEQAFSKHALRIAVGTVHQFQGSAADTVIFDAVDGPPRSQPGRLLEGDMGLRLVNVAITRARRQLIVIADQEWHRRKCKSAENSLLWNLITNRPEDQVWHVTPLDERAPRTKYESTYEARLGEAFAADNQFECMTAQYRICREDATLISRADFAAPDLKYAVYVDGPAYHLTPGAWRRDRRLRSELKEAGWAVSVFSTFDVTENIQRCLDEVRMEIFRLRED